MKKLFHQPLYKLGCFTKNHVVSRRVILGALLSLMTLPVFAETSNGIGVFSVSATKVVTFSPGNLQYHPKNDEWRFAENQYDIIGEDNKNISTDYDGWIDLFGWSGNDGSAKFGVSSSTANADYSGSFVDWGKNQIGSDAPDTWRTLTYDEWFYILIHRTNADDLQGVAEIRITQFDDVEGLILLPDNWTCPAGVTFRSGFNTSDSPYDYAYHQVINGAEWSKLEAAGAVFLPATNFHEGNYWATEYNGNRPHVLNIYSQYVLLDNEYADHRNIHRSVRLVKDL